jgi:hypothetical protein
MRAFNPTIRSPLWRHARGGSQRPASQPRECGESVSSKLAGRKSEESAISTPEPQSRPHQRKLAHSKKTHIFFKPKRTGNNTRRPPPLIPNVVCDAMVVSILKHGLPDFASEIAILQSAQVNPMAPYRVYCIRYGKPLSVRSSCVEMVQLL